MSVHLISGLIVSDRVTALCGHETWAWKMVEDPADADCEDCLRTAVELGECAARRLAEVSR